MDFTALFLTLSCLIIIAFFGTFILGSLEPYECKQIVCDDSKPIQYPLIPKIESYSNILQQIDEAQSFDQLNSAIVDIYIFSGTYKDSEGFKNILLAHHLLKENILLEQHLLREKERLKALKN